MRQEDTSVTKRFLAPLLLCLSFMPMRCSAGILPAVARASRPRSMSEAHALHPQAQQAAAPSTIRFEDATAKSGIQFTHSFGAQQLGSLLESTGSGCVWFDFNNDGLPDLYVVSGKPLEDAMHPYPLKQAPATPPHNHLYRNNGDGTFTDVTDQAGVAANIYGMAAIAADYDNDGFIDLFVTGYGKAILYHNNGDGTFTDVTAKSGIKVDGWSI